MFLAGKCFYICICEGSDVIYAPPISLTITLPPQPKPHWLSLTLSSLTQPIS